MFCIPISSFFQISYMGGHLLNTSQQLPQTLCIELSLRSPYAMNNNFTYLEYSLYCLMYGISYKQILLWYSIIQWRKQRFQMMKDIFTCCADVIAVIHEICQAAEGCATCFTPENWCVTSSRYSQRRICVIQNWVHFLAVQGRLISYPTDHYNK